MNESLHTPIAFFIFKRPKETSLVFETIRNIKPKVLFIVADGPRNTDEQVLCEQTRKIVEVIDWPCRVFRNYSDTNLGCKARVSSGLDWVFKNTDKAIILEDDCLPDQSFFIFCQEMLNKYKGNEEIMHIGGLNIQDDKSLVIESYYFSQIAQIWGWATWRRAWQKYDVNMMDWPQIKKERKLHNILEDSPTVDYFEYLFQRMYSHELDTWDVAWTYACMKTAGLSIVPSKNLIKNIGFGEGATHTKANKGNLGGMSTSRIEFPLIHPQKIEINRRSDKQVFKRVFGIQSRYGQRVLWFIKSRTPKTYIVLRSLFQNIKFLMKKF